jgi:KDO2-lipid IV(A) lauroyltransferase
MYDAMKEDNIELVVEFQGLEYLRSALFQGKGVILPVPHIGNVRLLHYALALKGFPVSVVSSEYGEDPEIVRRFKLEPTSSVHQVGFRGQFPRWIIDALKENRVLQIASTAEAGAVGVEVQFLGRRLYLTSGWIRLALSSGATVLPTWMMRGADHRHILKILPPLPLFEGNDRQQTINRTCQNLFQLFEPFYRSHPHLIDWMSWLVRLKEAKEHFKDES